MVSNLKENQIAHVEYTRTTDLAGGHKGDVTERWIIPTFIPHQNIKALDVTDLTEEQRQVLEQRLAEYQQYYRAAVESLFDFETWVDHTYNEESPQLKWRTFAIDNLKDIV